jgi:hypothetical protein
MMVISVEASSSKKDKDKFHAIMVVRNIPMTIVR